MIPGRTTRLTEGILSAGTKIAPITDIVLLNATTPIQYIVPPFHGVGSGIIFLVPTAGNVNLVSVPAPAGNIYEGATLTAYRAFPLIYSHFLKMWIIGPSGVVI